MGYESDARAIGTIGVMTGVRHVDSWGHDTLPLLDQVDLESGCCAFASFPG